jgi:SPP1 gp7 family putative phage head morphogenesis protein
MLIRRRRRKRPRKVPRPKLPIAAERLYLGALRGYARLLVSLVRERIGRSHPDLSERLDANDYQPKTVHGVTLKSLADVAARLAPEVQALPFARVHGLIRSHVKRDQGRVLGISSERIVSSGDLWGWRERNVGLITNMTLEQLGEIETILGQLQGQNVAFIAEELHKAFDFTESRVDLIARDQVLKENAQLTQEAHKNAGISRYVWSTSKDEAVRKEHAELEGLEFSYDDPPEVAKNGDTANPGEYYECRCCAIPVLPELEE